MYKGSVFSISLPTLVSCEYSIPSGMRWYLLGFWFAYPRWLVILSIFSCTCWISMSSLEKYLFRSSTHLFIHLLLHCVSSLYIFDVSPLSDIWYTDIFLRGCLFILLITFAMQKLLCDVVPLFFFCFWFLLLSGQKQTKTLSRPTSGSLSNMFCGDLVFFPHIEQHVKLPQLETVIRPMPPAVKVQSLYHWTTRGVQSAMFSSRNFRVSGLMAKSLIHLC